MLPPCWLLIIGNHGEQQPALDDESGEAAHERGKTWLDDDRFGGKDTNISQVRRIQPRPLVGDATADDLRAITAMIFGFPAFVAFFSEVEQSRAMVALVKHDRKGC